MPKSIFWRVLFWLLVVVIVVFALFPFGYAILSSMLTGNALYDVTDGRVTVQGEAASASQATQFFAALSAVPALQPLQWQMPTPTLLPNNAAQFQLTGNIP